MDVKGQYGWKGRLWRSCVYSALAIVVSTVIVVILASLEGATEQRSARIEIALYIFGSPLATGWFIVTKVFGGWRSVHQGQIALVPVFSVVVDAVMIFLAWEFWHRKTSKELDSTGTLGLNG